MTAVAIALINIGQVDLLGAVYGRVFTTPEVVKEVGIALPEWVEVQSAQDKDVILRLREAVDLGEASAIALALEFDDALLILDDQAARKKAKSLGLDFTGTVGTLASAKSVVSFHCYNP